MPEKFSISVRIAWGPLATLPEPRFRGPTYFAAQVSITAGAQSAERSCRTCVVRPQAWPAPGAPQKAAGVEPTRAVILPASNNGVSLCRRAVVTSALNADRRPRATQRAGAVQRVVRVEGVVFRPSRLCGTRFRTCAQWCRAVWALNIVAVMFRFTAHSRQADAWDLCRPEHVPLRAARRYRQLTRHSYRYC